MAFDYSEVKANADFWRKEVAPYVTNNLPTQVSFYEYLQAFYRSAVNKNTYSIQCHYIYSLDFIKKHQKKCVTCFGNTPAEMQAGAPPMSAIYQFNRNLHGQAGIAYWRDGGECWSHVNLYLVYENWDDVLKFVDNNMDLVKVKAESKALGFLK